MNSCVLALDFLSGTYGRNSTHFFHFPFAPIRMDRFYDPVKKRQILYGWSAEEDHDASARGWQVSTTSEIMLLDLRTLC